MCVRKVRNDARFKLLNYRFERMWGGCVNSRGSG